MTTKIAGLLAALLITTTTNAQTRKYAAAHIGLVYPLSTNGAFAKEYTNGFSLHAIGGMSYNEVALCASGVSSYVFHNADGVMAAGFSNHVRNEMNGVQLAGFMNTVRHNTRGMQAAGFMNIAGSLNGAQLGGFANITFEYSEGIQSAGFINLAVKDFRGMQAAGFMNSARNVDGLQLAGFINQASDADAQIAGFINIAKEVRGVQVAGFINIADSCDYPIAPINILKKGQKSLGVTAYDGTTTMATFRSGGRVLYGLVGAGYHHNSKKTLYAGEAGLGAHINIAKGFRVNIEGSSTSYTDFKNEVFMKSSLRIMPAVSIGKKLEVFAGPSLNHVNTDSFNGEEISNHYVWTSYNWGNFNGLYFGFAGGLHYHL